MSTDVLTILAIDDDRADAELLNRALCQIDGVKVDFVHVTTLDEARRALERVAVDVVFLDYRLGAQTGLELIEALRASGDLRPIICLTQYSDPQLAADLLRAGADDYLLKSAMDAEALRLAIAGATCRFHGRELERHNAQLVLDLQAKAEQLERNNRRLVELYDTAHEFVDNVSHEFRTPLTVIREFAAILRDGLAGSTNEKQDEYLGLIIGRTDDLSLMVDDMLDMSRLEAGLLRVFRRNCPAGNIINRIRATLESKAAPLKVKLDFPSDEGLPMLYCDDEKVARVIINLAMNAIKFSPQGGLVRITAEHQREAYQVRFAVMDQGPGIAADRVQEIFERFQQTDAGARCAIKGFGLGLAIAKELVHLNLGEIEVESRLGQGSTFAFTVPTLDYEHIVERRVQAISKKAKEGSQVSLVLADCGDSCKDASDAVDEFLHRQCRADDLVFRIQPTRWLLFLEQPGSALKQTIAQLQRALDEANRNRPNEPLPDLELKNTGHWMLPAAKRELLKTLRALCGVEEVHA